MLLKRNYVGRSALKYTINLNKIFSHILAIIIRKFDRFNYFRCIMTSDYLRLINAITYLDLLTYLIKKHHNVCFLWTVGL